MEITAFVTLKPIKVQLNCKTNELANKIKQQICRYIVVL